MSAYPSFVAFEVPGTGRVATVTDSPGVPLLGAMVVIHGLPYEVIAPPTWSLDEPGPGVGVLVTLRVVGGGTRP